jgi:deferrochelatase/peroxidase EfeB
MQELLAAKLTGRWRSGAPLVLAPEHDDPELACDPQRNNDFDYGQMDRRGLACPIGAHIWRVNPQPEDLPEEHRVERPGPARGSCPLVPRWLS